MPMFAWWIEKSTIHLEASMHRRNMGMAFKMAFLFCFPDLMKIIAMTAIMMPTTAKQAKWV